MDDLGIPDSPYLTIKEAVRYLRMEHLKYGDRMISRWVQEGRLRCHRRGRVLLFTREQLDRFTSR